jgi:hypothetical protein
MYFCTKAGDPLCQSAITAPNLENFLAAPISDLSECPDFVAFNINPQCHFLALLSWL